MQYSFICKKSI